MKVVILCGGKGTRLREETEFRPKPMIPIGDRPILWHIMKIYAAHGFKDFVLCLGYKGDMIKEYFRNYLWNTCDATLTLGRNANVRFHGHHDEEDWSITLADTGLESMTAWRIKSIGRFVLTASLAGSAFGAAGSTALPAGFLTAFFFSGSGLAAGAVAAATLAATTSET